MVSCARAGASERKKVAKIAETNLSERCMPPFIVSLVMAITAVVD
jgi:hypothetical protein